MDTCLGESRVLGREEPPVLLLSRQAFLQNHSLPPKAAFDIQLGQILTDKVKLWASLRPGFQNLII